MRECTTVTCNGGDDGTSVSENGDDGTPSGDDDDSGVGSSSPSTVLKGFLTVVPFLIVVPILAVYF